MTSFQYKALDAQNSRKLKTAISKLKLLLTKLRSNAGIGQCKKNAASEGATQGQSCENVLTNPPNQPSYKQCVVKCLFNRLRPEIPKDYQPVFDADFRKEPINCNIRKKRISMECKNRILVDLELMGTFWILLPGSRRNSWFAAEKFCKSRGLVLLTLDSKLKITQLMMYANSLVTSNRIMRMTENSPFRVWAGGMSVNDNNTYFWTDTGKQIDRDYFSGLNTTTGNNQKCIFIDIKAENSEYNAYYTWKEGDCDSTNRFICEVPKLCYFEKCKTKSQMRRLMNKERFVIHCIPKSCPVCTKQSSLVLKKKAIEDNIGRFFNLNGKLYFASNLIMTMDAAFSYCCKIKMNLWTWNSPTDGSQMVQILQSIGHNTNRTSVFVNAKDEKCDENYVWCDKQRRVLGPEYAWIEDEPVDIFGNEVCIKFSILNGRPAGFSDIQCTAKQYFICESQEPTNIVNTYLKVQKDPPVFELKIECRENRRCVKPRTKMIPDLKAGFVFQDLNRTYFFSSAPKMYWDAFAHCCSMGMHMATIDTREELLNVESIHYRNLTFKEFINRRIMFISTFYTTKKGSFWCSNDKPIDLNSIPLCLNDPDNAFPPETQRPNFLDNGIDNYGSLLINLRTLPNYKKCLLYCSFSTRPKANLPKNFEPVFKADIYEKSINCNLQLKRLSTECNNSLPISDLERMGIVHVLFSGYCKRFSWYAADKFCRSKGLVLARMDSKVKVDQLLFYISSLVNANKLPEMSARNPLNIWVGATSASQNNFFWVDTGQPIDADLMSASFEPDTDQSAKCLYANITSNQNVTWRESSCSSTFSFLCEVPQLCYFEKCKSKFQTKAADKNAKLVGNCISQKCPTCEDQTIISKSEKIKNDSTGRFFTFNERKFFISVVKRSFEDAVVFCCSLQMNLLTFESRDEGMKMMSVLKSIGFDLSFRFEMYLYAKDEACNENFVWCNKQRRTIGAEYFWDDNEPNDCTGNEVCVTLAMVKDVPVIRDVACFFKYLFICESQESSNESNTFIKMTARPMYLENKLECREKGRCVFPYKETSPDAKAGIVFKALGRTYFVSKERRDYWNAFNHCCSMGMHLATFDSWEEILAIITNYQDKITFREFQNARMMFISTFYVNSNKETVWCSSDQKMNASALPYGYNEPNNAYPPENVLALFSAATNSYGLGDANSFMPWQYICQSPNN
ncbi:Hypothetical predicted protein [Cloeon dipterum]|uniref:C-type lectin domain-containing protein n=1 Tax=Cloeon dipterum TaxID=197152 RepID=A0A8S1CS75_9INSE|nr:Hypothetical predicted protein [Cloeon dipterum]